MPTFTWTQKNNAAFFVEVFIHGTWCVWAWCNTMVEVEDAQRETTHETRVTNTRCN